MKLNDKFTEPETRNEGALIAYVCAGDPTPDDTPAIVHALVRGGADIIELGLPFPDRLQMVRRFRQQSNGRLNPHTRSLM